jgi:hypothetical protein
MSRFLVILACCHVASAWQLVAGRCSAAWQPQPRTTAAQVVMLAKKQQKPKKRVKKKGTSSSFSAPQPAASASPAAPPLSSDAPPLSYGRVNSDASLDDRLDSVLQRAGIASPASQSTAPPPTLGRLSAPDPSDPLSRIPKAGQDALERFFGGGALVFGSAFILSGLAIAVESIAKVLGRPLPTALDELLVQYVEPALTPSILILFFFSVSLGRARRART